MTGAAHRTDVVVVGGGPIGLAIAWRLLQSGRRVSVIDAEEPAAAWRVSAGMLSQSVEVAYGREELNQLADRALAGYPAFVAELEGATAIELHYAPVGSLAVALDRDEEEALAHRFESLRARDGKDVEWLRGEDCREREPLLSAHVCGGIYAPADGHIDPRRLVAALRDAIARLGGVLRNARVDGLELEGGRVSGVRIGAELIGADVVVLAAGAWMDSISESAASVGIRPVKGQIMRLAAGTWPAMLIETSKAYIFGRTSGELLLGATLEEGELEANVTAAGTFGLLEAGMRVIPDLRTWTIVATEAGFRPVSPDEAPAVGEIAPGLIVAGGHFRWGILLTPITAHAVCELVEHGSLPPLVAPFAPNRRNAHDQPR